MFESDLIGVLSRGKHMAYQARAVRDKSIPISIMLVIDYIMALIG